MDAPELVDDYYLNLLDWGVSNILSIALSNTVYLWDACRSATSELLTVVGDVGPMKSVKWAPDGRHIGVGLNNSVVQLWDSASNKQVEEITVFVFQFLFFISLWMQSYSLGNVFQ